MTTEDFPIVAEALGLEQMGAVFAGFVDGWPILARTMGNVCYFTVSTEPARDKRALKQLKALAKSSGIGIQWVNHELCFLFNKRTVAETSETELLRHCLSALGACGVTPWDKCPVCGQNDCDSAAPNGNVFRLVHIDCLARNAEKAQNAKEENDFSGSYITGLIGALLGMIVGTLPSLLVIILSNTVYSLLMALIPICAYFGYKLLRGKMNAAALVISIIMAVLGVLLIQWELFVYYVMQEDNVSLGKALNDVLPLLSDGQAWSELMEDTAGSFLMAALGVWFSFSIISRTYKKTADSARLSLEYARTRR